MCIYHPLNRNYARVQAESPLPTYSFITKKGIVGKNHRHPRRLSEWTVLISSHKLDKRNGNFRKEIPRSSMKVSSRMGIKLCAPFDLQRSKISLAK